MSKILLKGIFALLTLSSFLVAKPIVLQNDDILSDAVADKITQIGNELKDKSGIFVAIATIKSLNSKSLDEVADEFSLTPPFALLLLSKDDSKVEIFADDKTIRLFDKEQILSPFPERGTILPILTSRKGQDIFNAAMLNGYADMSEQIASSLNIELQNGIGSANKVTINLLRIIIYIPILLLIFMFFYKKIKAKDV